MKKKKIAVVAAVMATVFVGGYSWGQNQAQPDDRDKITAWRGDTYFAEQAPSVANGKNWAQLYKGAAQDPELLQGVALSTYFDLNKTSATNKLLVVQAMQNQKLIEQNDRIISLMEEAAKK
jgi:hypothetical protein